MATVKIGVFLFLFLSQTWGKEEQLHMVSMKQDNSKTNVTVDPWSELEELRDIVIEQKIDMIISKSRIEKLEEEKAELISWVTTSMSRVTKVENQVTALDSEVKELKRQNAEAPKVAFSVGLTGAIGPFTTDMTLRFTKTISNFGQAYNTHTGIFTAPVHGVYYFRFTGFSTRSSLTVSFHHNDKRLAMNGNWDNTGCSTVTNGFVLELEKGGVVYLALPSSNMIYDYSNTRTVFSGFLISPLELTPFTINYAKSIFFSPGKKLASTTGKMYITARKIKIGKCID